jgi:hypothetical protein
MSLGRIKELEARRERLYQEALVVAEREPFTLSDQLAYRALNERVSACTEYLNWLEAELLEGLRHDKRNRKTSRSKQAGVACSA